MPLVTSAFQEQQKQPSGFLMNSTITESFSAVTARQLPPLPGRRELLPLGNGSASSLLTEGFEKPVWDEDGSARFQVFARVGATIVPIEVTFASTMRDFFQFESDRVI